MVLHMKSRTLTDCTEKRDETLRCWSKLFNVQLHNLYFSPNIISMIKPRRTRWTGHVAHKGRVLVGRPEVERQLLRPRHRWEDNNNNMDV